MRQRVGRILQVPQAPSRPLRAALAVAGFIPVTVAASVADLRMIGEMPAALIAQVATAVPVADTLNEPAGPSAGAVSDVPPTRQVVRPVSLHAREGGRRVRVNAGESSAGDVATAAMTVADDGPGPGSDVPIIPALASAVSWSFTTLPDSTAVAPTAEISDGVTPPDTPTLWGAAATGGVAIGRSSRKAAVSTAGLFARVGKSIAGSF